MEWQRGWRDDDNDEEDEEDEDDDDDGSNAQRAKGGLGLPNFHFGLEVGYLSDELRGESYKKDLGTESRK